MNTSEVDSKDVFNAEDNKDFDDSGDDDNAPAVITVKNGNCDDKEEQKSHQETHQEHHQEFSKEGHQETQQEHHQVFPKEGHHEAHRVTNKEDQHEVQHHVQQEVHQETQQEHLIIGNTNQRPGYFSYIKDVIIKRMMNYFLKMNDEIIKNKSFLKYFWKTLYSMFFITVIVFITILPMVFIIGEWEGAHQVVNLQSIICERNVNGSFSKIELEPWNEGVEKKGIQRSLEFMFINQKFYSKSREFSSLLQAISIDYGKYSKRYLLVAEKGSGKTTAIKKLLKDWCYNLKKENKSFRTFKYAIQNYVEGYVHDNVRWNFIFSNILPTVPRILYEIITKCMYEKGTQFENMISLYNTLTKKEKMPRLMFAFEFRDIINLNTLADTVFQKIIQDATLFTQKNLDIILNREVRNVLLVLDGWDEYTNLKHKGRIAPAMEAIVYHDHEEMENINLIVSTRPWRSDELLMIPRYRFEKLSLYYFHLPNDRDNFIHNFFPAGPYAQELINILNEKDTIVPEELQRQPRMLLYICNAWKHDKKLKDDQMKNKEIFWDAIWKMMKLTYNRKYPNNTMTDDDLKKLRQEVGTFNLKNGKDKNISFKTFYEKFGDEFDPFSFGIYSTVSYQTSAPWNEDGNDEMEQYVKPFMPSIVDAQADIEMKSRN